MPLNDMTFPDNLRFISFLSIAFHIFLHPFRTKCTIIWLLETQMKPTPCSMFSNLAQRRCTPRRKVWFNNWKSSTGKKTSTTANLMGKMFEKIGDKSQLGDKSQVLRRHGVWIWLKLQDYNTNSPVHLRINIVVQHLHAFFHALILSLYIVVTAQIIIICKATT